jgi:GntR family transcriptional regulator, phosphonate transport system regulatory protein
LRRISRLETRPCDGDEAAALHLPLATAVHVVEGISLADGQPIAMFRSVFPAARFPALLAQLALNSSVTAALAAEGVSDYTRAQTRITAKLASAMQALALQISEGAPLLRSVAVNVDQAGVAVEFGTTWFAGDRVTLTVAPEGAAPDLS